MAVQIYPWENRLISLAYDVFSNEPVSTPPNIQETGLDHAYEVCREITTRNSRSFSLAALLLPGKLRASVHALYAFCRTTDDIVDRPGDNPSQRLQVWRAISLDNDPAGHSGVAKAWIHTRLKFGIPRGYAEQLIDGVTRDLTQKRYNTYEDLALYCYGVASTVGLMFMNITGYQSSEAIPYAVRMGVALQLTNILRDIGEDWKNGRLYLPREEMETFGLTEADINQGKVTEKWRDFMRFQISRANRLYQESMPGIRLVNRAGQMALMAAADFYRGILRDIENHDYNVFNRRAHLTSWEKIRRIPSLWWRAKNPFR